MTTNEDIRTAQLKVRESYATSPDSTLSTSHASAEIGHGLKCVFKQGTETAVMNRLLQPKSFQTEVKGKLLRVLPCPMDIPFLS